VPVVLAARDTGAPPSPLLPMAPGERVLVLGLDGVLPDEVEYLLRRGDLPAMAALERQGGRLLRYPRPDEPPAALWTSLATGLAPPEHGVAALDSFLPLGVRTPLARSGFLRSYWSRVEVPLHLSAYRPVLSNRRSAFTLWELASRGGAPVLAVNWWATFPAPRVAGLVLSHDAYQLLRQGAAGAVSASDATADLLRQARDIAAAPAPGLPSSDAADFEVASAPGGDGEPYGTGAAVVGSDGPDALASRAAGEGRGAGAAGRGAGGNRGAGAEGRGADRDHGSGAEAGGGSGGLTVLNAALPAREAAAVGERAVRPDWFYRRVFASRLGASGSAPGAAALYLPGLDIAAAGWQGSDVAFGDLVRQELRAADRLLTQALAESGWGSIVVVFDPGRRLAPTAAGATEQAAGSLASIPSRPSRPSRRSRLAASLAGDPAGAQNSGRVLLWQRRGCSPEPVATTLESIAAGLLRTLGLPQSAELPPPPAQCHWPDAPATVATYGHPPPTPTAGVASAAGAAAEGTEYLQNLRSLGYL
jgi:hypothetical protein